MDDLAQFFLSPNGSLHRRYEILRALCVEKLTAKTVAKRFDCSVFTVNAAKRDFAKEIREGRLPEFFLSPCPGRKPREDKDELREKVVSMRKQNHSILDIQAYLDSVGLKASHDYIHRILTEEGFERLPRRTTLERRRGAVVKLDAPRSREVEWDKELGKIYHCEGSLGLLAFLPIMARLGVHRWILQAGYPGTTELSSIQSVMSFLAVKLSGYERFSHDDHWAMDRALGLFAGLNVLPKDSTLSSYSYRVDREMNRRFLKAMLRGFIDEDLFCGMMNLDFTAIPHWGDESVLENNWSGKRGKALKSVLSLLCQDAQSGIFAYSDAELRHRNQSDAVLEFVDFWKKGARDDLKCLIFDSKFTTYENLVKLDKDGVKFITLRRRGKKIISEAKSLRPDQWQRLTLDPSRKHPSPRVNESTVYLTSERHPFRQLIITDNGREQPAFIITNEWDWPATRIIEQYGSRWIVEKGISEQVDFFHLNSLSSSIVVKVDFDLTLTMAAHNLYRAMGIMLEGFEWETSKSLHTKFFSNGGSFRIDDKGIQINLKKKRHLPTLMAALKEMDNTRIPWLENRFLRFSSLTVT